MRKRRRITFYYLLGKFPPCLCRLLARHKLGGPMSVTEISHESALPPWKVIELSRMTSWEGVDVATIRSFSHGCGIDFDDPVSIKRKLVYLAGKNRGKPNRTPPRFTYLRRSESWETFYKPLIMEWTNAAQNPRSS